MLKRIAVLIVLLLANSGAFSCEEQELPVELLGKNTFRKEVDFKPFLAVIERAPSPDADLLPKDKIFKSLFVIDEKRAFYSLSTTDGVVVGIGTSDKCIVTKEGIRVGDRFSDVLAAYPASHFERESNLYWRSGFDIVTKDAKLTFLFRIRDFESIREEKNYEKWDNETKDALRVKAILITTQAKRNLSSRSGIGGVLSAT